MKLAPLILLYIVSTLSISAQEAKPRVSLVALEGSVVNAQGGEPIRKATIQAIADARGQGQPAVYSGQTDSEGNFRIESMSPGRYRVYVERTGFIDVDRHRRRSEGEEVTLEAGKPVSDLVLRVIPAGAISGRVLDEDGDPIPNVGVTVLRRAYVSCRPQLDSDGSERTNDIGEYRVGGLMPGKYFISVNPLPSYSTSSDKTERSTKPEMSYTTTYYPGVIDAAQASALDLHAGETVPVDFSLARVPSFSIRGTIANLPTTSSNTHDLGIVILRPQSAAGVGHEAEIDRAGKFEFHGVPPGSYTISALTGSEGVPSSAQPLDITSADVNNVQLTAEAGGHVRGLVRIQGRNADLSGLHIALRPIDRDVYLGAIGSDTGAVKRDGTFELPHVPAGSYELTVVGTLPTSPALFVTQVQSGGREVSDNTLRIINGAINVEVIISAATAQIDGTVAENNQPAPNATVVAIPSPSRRGVSDHYATALTDQHGRFHMQGLRPDAYTFMAWDVVDEGAWCDPEFLKNYEGSGQSVRLEEGARETIDLKLVSTRNSPK